MSTHIPLRLARIPAHPLRRQCLFQQPRPAPAPRHFAVSTSRPFSATTTRYRRKGPGYRVEDEAVGAAASELIKNPAPSVYLGRMAKEIEAMPEDIGLLQNTIVRAPLSQLPPMTTRAFWSYMWTLFKSKLAGLYTRSLYRRCIEKEKASRYLPMDLGKNKELARRAKELYESIHRDFAIQNISNLEKTCLQPLAYQFIGRVNVATPVNMVWKLEKWNSARVLSHLASPMGEEHPDTCYRQVVVRLDSVQRMKAIPKSIEKTLIKGRKPAWAPEGVQETPVLEETIKSEDPVSEDPVNETKTVVDYFVMQQRVMQGEEEEWKAWGFTEPSTPETLKADEEYWRKATEMQAASRGA